MGLVKSDWLQRVIDCALVLSFFAKERLELTRASGESGQFLRECLVRGGNEGFTWTDRHVENRSALAGS